MVTINKSRFKIGDWIVHYIHGVGKVKDIVKKGLDDNRKSYYKVSTKDLDYWLPIDGQDVGHIEPLRSKEDFEEALKVLSSTPQPLADHHKARKAQIHNRWLDGDLHARAELLRDLYGRLKFSKLNFNEKQTLEKIKSYFISEWVVVDQALTKSKARKKLRDALKTGVQKARKSEE